jgi:hypothetical protein
MTTSFVSLFGKTFTPPRHKDAKMNFNQKVTRFALCLGAFVAVYSAEISFANFTVKHLRHEDTKPQR